MVEHARRASLAALSDDDVHAALESFGGATIAATSWARTSTASPIFRDKRKPLSPATVNRCAAAIPRCSPGRSSAESHRRAGSIPCRRDRASGRAQRAAAVPVRRRTGTASSGLQASSWARLYLLVLMAIHTGARRVTCSGSLVRLDLDGRVAHVGRTKNGDPGVLPLTEPVMDELRKFDGTGAALVFPSERRPTSPLRSRSCGRTCCGLRRSRAPLPHVEAHVRVSAGAERRHAAGDCGCARASAVADDEAEQPPDGRAQERADQSSSWRDQMSKEYPAADLLRAFESPSIDIPPGATNSAMRWTQILWRGL